MQLRIKTNLNKENPNTLPLKSQPSNQTHTMNPLATRNKPNYFFPILPSIQSNLLHTHQFAYVHRGATATKPLASDAKESFHAHNFRNVCFDLVLMVLFSCVFFLLSMWFSVFMLLRIPPIYTKRLIFNREDRNQINLPALLLLVLVLALRSAALQLGQFIGISSTQSVM